jgi:hypothetical protein
LYYNAGTREIEITVPGELQMQVLWVQERSKKLNVFITSSQDTLNHIYNGCYDALINAFGTDYLSLFYPKIVDPQNNAEFMHIIYKGVPSLTAFDVLKGEYVPNTQDVLKNQKNHQTRFFGDMHANAHKMIIMLESDGVLTFSDKDQDKKTVQQLYYSNDINVTAFHDFMYSGNIKAISQLSPLVFIGDLLADRGKNDLLILFILDFLNKNKISFSIVYSNHDAEFVKNIVNIYHQKYDNISDQLGSGQAQSLHGLKQSLQKGLYTNDIASLIKSYLDKLQLIKLIPHQDKTLMVTHAPLNARYLKEMITWSAVKENITLEKVVNQLNVRFVEYLNNLTQGYDSESEEFKKFIFNFIWNRDVDSDFTVAACWQKLTGEALNITDIHGHDGNGKTLYPESINLDNTVGKVPNKNDYDGSFRIPGEFQEPVFQSLYLKNNHFALQTVLQNTTQTPLSK